MERQAHPYRDLAVIDSRAPRTNQTVVAVIASLAVATGAWPLLGLLALQLAIAVRFGRRYCLPCRLYFDVLQPRFGEGPLEDARAPRFANIIGAGVLAAATGAYAVGQAGVGAALGLMVVALATVAATTGLCVGCELYKIVARVRGIRGGTIDRIDLAGLGAPAGRGGSRPCGCTCRHNVGQLLNGGPGPGGQRHDEEIAVALERHGRVVAGPAGIGFRDRSTGQQTAGTRGHVIQDQVPALGVEQAAAGPIGTTSLGHVQVAAFFFGQLAHPGAIAIHDVG